MARDDPPELPPVPTMRTFTSQHEAAYKRKLREYTSRYRRGAILCFAGWLATTTVPVIFTAIAFVILQTDPVASVRAVLWLTGLASMLGTIGVFAKFDMKWRANSATVYDAREIELALLAPDVPMEYFRDSLMALQRRHEVRWEAAKF